MATPNLAAALQLLVDHVPMPSDHRARIMAELTGVPYQSGPPIVPDPRDEEIRALKAQLAGKSPSTYTFTPGAPNMATVADATKAVEAAAAALAAARNAVPFDQAAVDRATAAKEAADNALAAAQASA